MNSADSYFLSFTLYAVPANLIGGMFFVVGRQKAGLLVSEYFFIYIPWFVLVLLSLEFFQGDGMWTEDLSLQVFILLIQSAACGVLGGVILWPRFLYRADTTREKLRITALSALAVSVIYAVSRTILFAAMRTVM